VKDMLAMNATDVRNDWSSIVDSVVREKPKFIKRTRDYMFLSNLEVLEGLLALYTFNAEIFAEEDGSVTLSLFEIDLIENGKDEQEARLNLAKSILEYSEDYYKEFSFWSSAPNRKPHVPYVFKSLILNDIEKIGELIECHLGKN